MSKHIKKSHNKTLLLYHLVCPVRYRRKVFTKAVKQTLVEICQGIQERYDIFFIEIGTDKDHVHFLIQSIPSECVTDIVQTIKSLTARKIFESHKEVEKILWGGKFWSSGYYVNTVGKHGNEDIIKNYVKNQGKQYQQLYQTQMTLFEY